MTVNINPAIRYAAPTKSPVGTTLFEKADAKSSSAIKCNKVEKAVGGGFLLDGGGDSTMASIGPSRRRQLVQ